MKNVPVRPPCSLVQPTTKDLSVTRILNYSGIIYLHWPRIPRDGTCGYELIRDKIPMTQFRQRAGTKSAVRHLKKPLPDIIAFDAAVRSLIMKNPLGCTSYRSVKKHHPPVERVREMYTAKFVYETPEGKRIGSSSEVYDSVEGYHTGIAAVISNMANTASHRGKVKHLPEADLFSVLLKCHDPEGELYFLSLARNRITLSSYSDDAIRKRIERWTDSMPALA